MGNERELDPPSGDNTGSPRNQSSGSAMTRAQSNLDILSQTAAVMVEEEGIVSAQASPPYPPARVTPAELPTSSGTLRSENTYLVESSAHHCRNSFLLLPDMSSRSAAPRPAVFLEQKRGGFLPPPFESGGVLVGSGATSMDAASSYFAPGLFVSYSNGSHPGVAMSSSEGYSVASRASPPPPQHLISQFHHATTATVSTGSETSGASGNTAGNVGTGGGDVTTVMNSFLSAASNSFSSTGGVSASSVVGSVPTLTGGASTMTLPPPGGTAQFSMQAFIPPPRPPIRTDGATTNIEFSDETLRENFLLRQQLAARDATIANLQGQLESLQREVRQLRRLPTGKISQIPLEDMLQIMREYGSEVSETSMPPRKSFVQHASVVRQFRRWNPNFHDWFEHVDGQWRPKLGKAGELKRREEARRLAGQQRKKQKTSGDEASAAPSLDAAPKNDEAVVGMPPTVGVKHATEV